MEFIVTLFKIHVVLQVVLSFICVDLLASGYVIKDSNKTYYTTDPDGTNITCGKCPPGTYLDNHCSVNMEPATCLPCPIGQFQEHHNTARYCNFCKSGCAGNTAAQQPEEIVKNCTSISDLECDCKEGHYRTSICKEWSMCEVGHGVVAKGNATHDAICKACTIGYFSSVNSYDEPCRRCQECNSDELAVPHSCSPTDDRICKQHPEHPPKDNIKPVAKPNPKNEFWFTKNGKGTIAGIALATAAIIISAIVILVVYRKSNGVFECTSFRN